jgi:hypothetical protein
MAPDNKTAPARSSLRPCSESEVGPWKVEIPGVETQVVKVEWDDRGFCVVPIDGDRQFPVHLYPENTKWTCLIPGFPQPNNKHHYKVCEVCGHRDDLDVLKCDECGSDFPDP